MATSQLVSVYFVEIDSHSLFQDMIHGVTVSVDDDGMYNIDFTSDMQTWFGGSMYGVIAVNNGYVHPLYANNYGTGYAYDYRVKNNLFFGDSVMDSWIVYVTENAQTSTGNYWRPASLEENAIDARIKFGDSPYATSATIEQTDEVQIISISINEGLMSDSFFSYGSTYSPNCSVTMTKCDYAVPGVWFRVEYKVDGVWQCFGVFKINSAPTKTSSEISFQGIGMIEAIWQNTEYSTTYQYNRAACYLCDFEKITKEQTGVPVIIDFKDDLLVNNQLWQNLVIPAKLDSDGTTSTTKISLGDNYREMWSNLATVFHSNVVEKNGAIHIIHIDDNIADDARRFLFDGTQYTQEPSDAGYYYYASPINVKVNQSKYGGIVNAIRSDSHRIYEVPAFSYMGVDQTPNMVNEKISKTDHTYISYPVTIDAERLWYFTTYLDPQHWFGGAAEEDDWTRIEFRMLVTDVLGFDKDVFAYKPMSIELMGYHPCIFPGSRIAVDNGNIVDYMGLVGNVTITYDGALSMQISTPCDVQIEGINGTSSGGSGVSSSTGLASFTSFVLSVQDASAINDGAITNRLIADSAITGSKIEDSTITNSKILRGSLAGSSFADGTITGSKIADSTIENTNIKNGTITGSKIASSTIENSNIRDGTITGTKINFSSFENGTISGSAIDTSTFTNGSISGSKIASSTITETQIEDSTITNAKIADSTITNAKISDATIGYAKMDSAFISDLTSQTAYINNLKSNVADINTLTANDAIIQNIFSNSIISSSAILNTLQSNIINAEYIKSAVADIGYLTADDADIRYANIKLTNIKVADIGRFYADSGILTDVLIQDGNVTGTLNGVRINADVITTGTLSVDRLLVTGENSIVYQINVDSSGLSKSELSKEVYQKYLNGTDIVANSITATQIAAGTITAAEIASNTITANKLDINDVFANSAVIAKIFAQNVTASGTITGATLKGTDIESTKGKIGGWTIGNTSISSTYGNETISLNSSGANIVGENTSRKSNYSLNAVNLQYTNTADSNDYCRISKGGITNHVGNTTISLGENGHTAASSDKNYRYSAYSYVSQYEEDKKGFFAEKRPLSSASVLNQASITPDAIQLIDNNTYTSGSSSSAGGQVVITSRNPFSSVGTYSKKTVHIDTNGFFAIYDESSNEKMSISQSGYILTNSTVDVKGGATLSAGLFSGVSADMARLYKNGLIMSSPGIKYDQGWIRMLGSDESDSVLEIATGDDGGAGEQIVVRQYNASNAVARELKLFDTSGNTRIPGKLTFNGGKSTDTIILPGNDSKGIEPATNNCGYVGSSSKKFYNAYITNVYTTGGSIASGNGKAVNGGTVYNYFSKIHSATTKEISSYSNFPKTTWRQVGSISLSAGTWLIAVSISWSNNWGGYRELSLSESANSWFPINGNYNLLDQAVHGNADYNPINHIVGVVTLTASKTLYVNAAHSNGDAIQMIGGTIQYFRLY